jgi:adenylate cyclase
LLAVVPLRDGGRLDGATEAILGVFDGLTTWLATSLTAPALTRTPLDLQRIGQETGARYILHGWTEGEHGRLRLTMELHEASSGRVLWSGRLDRNAAAAAALRQDATLRVSRAVPAALFQRELDRCALEPSLRLTAHDLALWAYAAIMQPRPDTFAAAASMLVEAAEKPGPLGSTRFAQVWWHLMAIGQGWSGSLCAAGTAAAMLDLADPAATALQAYMQSVLHRDHARAVAMLDRVLEVAPQCSLAGSLRALTLCWLGKAQEAVASAQHAAAMPALGPERAWREQVAALAHYLAGNYGDAVRRARACAAHHPGLAPNGLVLAASLAVLGQLDEAAQAAAQVLTVDPDFRIEPWRQRSMLPDAWRDTLAQRLRLAALPG